MHTVRNSAAIFSPSSRHLQLRPAQETLAFHLVEFRAVLSDPPHRHYKILLDWCPTEHLPPLLPQQLLREHFPCHQTRPSKLRFHQETVFNRLS